ncbi:unnamed protein product [Protopolystoma xenopodis]|uniref:Uncharacterized protein n=1 Tax=Protopolystoma xenopodis TaxID=117903 RepID=A0A3S5CHF0_9PLAT|nr:unnamed protein product [Protopolystoma xenopodis]
MEVVQNEINVLLDIFRQEVQQSLTRQEEQLSQLETKAEMYFGKAGSVKTQEATGNYLTDMRSALDAGEQMLLDFQEGIDFYAKLTEVLLKLSSKVNFNFVDPIKITII